MEIIVIEKSKNKIIFELKGEDHTFSNALKDALMKTKHVEIATYDVEHPLVSSPRFIVETDGADPVKCLQDAAKTLQKEIGSLRDSVKKLK